MTKIGLFLLTLALVVPAMATAANADELGMRKGSYGKAGCGLGSMVFESNSNMSQVFAATTNGTFGTQTFGISTGTSNCASDGVAKIEKEKEMFIAMNFETLSKEMAQGKGETVDTFASLLGCSDSAVKDFGHFAQSKYASTFSKASTPAELLTSVNSEIASDASLSKSCTSKI